MSMVEAVASGLVNGNGVNGFQLNEAPAPWYSSTMLLKSKKMEAVAVPPPYVQPRLKRSSGFLSQKSLEMCTECLVSETGSDEFLDIEEIVKQVEMDRALSDGSDVFNHVIGKKELSIGVNYHGSYTKNKFFPPPLPSISRRDGRCVLMKPQRKDGHLILNTTLAPSKNYLHCQREGGRLQLSFVETSFKEIYHEIEDPIVTRQRNAAEAENQPEPVAEAEEEEEEEEEEEDDDEEEYEEEEEEEMAGMEVEEEEDDEEEVEVVNRGNVVEVKVSCLPQLLTGGMKVHRSSLVINKFVGMPLDSTPMAMETPVLNVEPSNTDSTVKTSPTRSPADNKLLFSSKKMMNRQALLHQVRRCGEYNRPLFFWEHCCIAT